MKGKVKYYKGNEGELGVEFKHFHNNNNNFNFLWEDTFNVAFQVLSNYLEV